MTRRRTVATFLATTVLFGTAFPAIEVGLRDLPPLSFAASRYALSAALLLGYASATTDDWLPTTRGDAVAVAAGGVFLIGATGLTFVGQQTTTSGVAAIIVSLSPVVTALFAWALLPAERPSRRGLIGVLVGFVGVAIVVRPGPLTASGSTVLGRALILTATVSLSLGTVLIRRSDHALPSPALTGWAMLVGAAIQVAGAVALGEPAAGIVLTPAALAAVGYLGVFAGAFGFVLYFSLLDSVGPLEANLVSYLVPVVTLVTGRLLLDEAIQPAAVVGFLVILAGFALLKNREIVAELARYRGAGR